MTSSCAAAATRGGRHHHQDLISSRSRRRSRRPPPRRRPTLISAPRTGSTRSSPAPSCGFALFQELKRLAPYGLGNPGVTLLIDGCELTELTTVGDGRHLKFRVRAPWPRRRLSDLVRPRRPTRPLSPGRPLRRRLPPRGKPLERNGLAAAQRQADRRRRSASRSCARGSPTSGALGEPAWTPEARAIFAELELKGENGQPGDGSLLESESFRRLLDEQPPLAAAA